MQMQMQTLSRGINRPRDGLRDGACSKLHIQYRILIKTNVFSASQRMARRTRVCMIDFVTNKVIYDQLATPPSQISDHLTRCVHNLRLCARSLSFLILTPDFSFSGITAQTLELIMTMLADE